MKNLENKALTIQEKLVELLRVKEEPAVSIILHNETPSPRNEKFQITLKDAIKEAIKNLEEKGYEKRVIRSLEEKMNNLEEKIYYENISRSLVMYVSPNYEEVIDLPFKVENKIIVDNSFETRDLLRTVNRLFKYDVILLSKKKTRFFNGFHDVLMELPNDEIPEGMDFYLENKISFKDDPGKAESEAMRLYVLDVDKFLRTYTDMYTPLIVMGDKKLVSYFKNNTKRPGKIMDEIYGSYDDSKLSEIEKKVTEKLNEYISKRDDELLERVQPDIDRYSYVSGIQEAWEVAAMKEARIMLVEQGYKVEGYSINNGLFLVFDKPENDEYDYHADVIDDLAEMVLLQGGEVYFLSPGKLEKFDKILMTTRV
jgi:hypothetical protein